ncbi:hypothetical protein B0H14DRAFT_2567923 [Mycena olivaceomarginata]|nr:hypothetical protein B0H14DRAFT_2567923 [Mycena olivaceomarginata]
MNTRSSSARQKRCAPRGLVPQKRTNIRSRVAPSASLSGNEVHVPVATCVYATAASPTSPAWTSSAKCRPMPNTNTTWAKEDIVMFLLEVARWKDDVRKISVGLKSKDCYKVLTVAGLLHGRLDAQHVESCSKALGDSYKVTIKSQPSSKRELRRREEFGTGAELFEGRSSGEVDTMDKLFFEMNSAPVDSLYIKSTSIIKKLSQIKKRDDKFGRKARALRNKWANN